MRLEDPRGEGSGMLLGHAGAIGGRFAFGIAGEQEAEVVGGGVR